MSRMRSWLKVQAQSSDRPLLLSQDILRQYDVKEDLDDKLRTDVFSTSPGDKDYKIDIDDEGAETVTVEFSDASKTEDVLQALRELLYESRVMS